MIGIIFDLDGTLLDSLRDLGSSANTVLAKRGLEMHNMDTYSKFVGNGIKKLVERAFPENYEALDEAFEEFVETYKSNLTVHSKAYPGILDLLLELQNRGIKLAISTNKAQDMTDQLVPHYFPDIEFIEIIGDRFDDLRKPNPHYPNLIKEKMGVDKVLFVGDSDVDVQTALNANMVPVGVAWGFRGEEELVAAGAELILHTPQDLIDYLDSNQ